MVKNRRFWITRLDHFSVRYLTSCVSLLSSVSSPPLMLLKADLKSLSRLRVFTLEHITRPWATKTWIVWSDHLIWSTLYSRVLAPQGSFTVYTSTASTFPAVAMILKQYQVTIQNKYYSTSIWSLEPEKIDDQMWANNNKTITLTRYTILKLKVKIVCKSSI